MKAVRLAAMKAAMKAAMNNRGSDGSRLCSGGCDLGFRLQSKVPRIKSSDTISNLEGRICYFSYKIIRSLDL